MPKYKGLIASSQDPSQIANTVKGIVLSLSAIIILAAQQFFHIGLNANDVLSLATEAGMAAGAVWTIYGLVMKVVVYFGKNTQPAQQ